MIRRSAQILFFILILTAIEVDFANENSPSGLVIRGKNCERIALDLGDATGLTQVSVRNLLRDEDPVDLGICAPGRYVFEATSVSDWLLVSQPREPIPVTSITTSGTQILINGAQVFLVGQMDYNVTTGRPPEAIAHIFDVMMVPYGMNLLMARLGIISWGEWNNIVNIERGLEEDRVHYRYPYVVTETGRTNFDTHLFDLDRFDESFFRRTRRIIELANERGIVPIVGLFSEHAIDHPLHWRGHPFNPVNNINDLGLPADRAIPEFFENPKALALQEEYVKRLLSEIDDLTFILEPFGEVNKAPDAYIDYWLRLFEQHEAMTGRPLLVCLSGRKTVIDRFANDPAVDLIDIYCYHDGQYDGAEVNRAEGEKGVFTTVSDAVRLYGKPVTKLYFKYGYPYADRQSPWANPKTGTQGGGDPFAAREALDAVERAGGVGLYFKMAWARDRGTPMTPDLWSEYIMEFVESHSSNSWRMRTQGPQLIKLP